ncbi:MAG: ATP-dependent sacrificial sulfur transferase LarE [Thermodesulfobacteriota bacterium]|nr:ATP-dependent sacrificial sulfur transferase LarE [Thermodesulfobacteriota bacterium]
MSLEQKYQQLKSLLSEFNSVAVAFSGGVDSTLLLKVACDSFGADKVLALSAISPIFPHYEIEQSKQFARELGVRQLFIASNEMELTDFTENRLQRCYYCKHNLFSLFLQKAKEMTVETLFDGSNLDDQDDYRPGQKAITQLNIRSPLLEVKLGKQEIRKLSHQLGLSTWDKQPFACLATRFPYGTKITNTRLKQIDQCETWLRRQGFLNYRVRYHNQLARIEVSPEEIPRLLNISLRLDLIAEFKLNGFDYVTVDLQGYRSGSMNEILSDDIIAM